MSHYIMSHPFPGSLSYLTISLYDLILTCTSPHLYHLVFTLCVSLSYLSHLIIMCPSNDCFITLVSCLTFTLPIFTCCIIYLSHPYASHLHAVCFIVLSQPYACLSTTYPIPTCLFTQSLMHRLCLFYPYLFHLF